MRGPIADWLRRDPEPDALAFVDPLSRRFGPPREQLLARRREVQALHAGELPDFLPETARSAKRTGRWRRSRPTCTTGGSRSPGRSTGR